MFIWWTVVLWALDFPSVIEVKSTLFSQGKPLINSTSQVEDYATAVITLESGAVVRLACSWNLQVGCEAIISATFFGTEGGVALRNLNGSFYDFVAECYRGYEARNSDGTTRCLGRPRRGGLGETPGGTRRLRCRG